jgi:phenylpyruvate tautomerase PptA (4-oxalocrotonate tautomerase family)
MPQVKIYGLQEILTPKRAAISDAIHSCLVNAFSVPEEKRFQRFILLERDDFIFPSDRTENYTIVELSLFEGRSEAVKQTFIRLLYAKLQEVIDLEPNDLEITIFETPSSNWGIRGVPGNELKLNYTVNV